jgi:Holliday junction resolvase RusA-like endonuclease
VITFTAYGIPAPQGSTKAFMRRGMKHPVITADCARTKPWRQAIVDASRDALEHHAVMAGPVEVFVVFYMPRPKSAPRRVTEPTTKPDIDKLERALLDALTAAGVWRDDAQVIHVHSRKAFAGGAHDEDGPGGVPRAHITVETVEATT